METDYSKGSYRLLEAFPHDTGTTILSKFVIYLSITGKRIRDLDKAILTFNELDLKWGLIELEAFTRKLSVENEI